MRDEKLTSSIEKIIKEIETIKPGMKRKDLFSVFTEEGGLSTFTQRTYVYKSCPYIKVDVQFTQVDPGNANENPEDVIVEISKPYLGWSIGD